MDFKGRRRETGKEKRREWGWGAKVESLTGETEFFSIDRSWSDSIREWKRRGVRVRGPTAD